MRAWMYQLNPSKGEFSSGPTTTANLFDHELSGEMSWYVTQHFRNAQPRDPILIKSASEGIVACGRIARIGVGERAGEHRVLIRAILAASRRLRANPIPVEWIRSAVKKSQRNLVELEQAWNRLAPELARRNVFFGHV